MFGDDETSAVGTTSFATTDGSSAESYGYLSPFGSATPAYDFGESAAAAPSTPSTDWASGLDPWGGDPWSRPPLYGPQGYSPDKSGAGAPASSVVAAGVLSAGGVGPYYDTSAMQTSGGAQAGDPRVASAQPNQPGTPPNPAGPSPRVNPSSASALNSPSVLQSLFGSIGSLGTTAIQNETVQALAKSRLGVSLGQAPRAPTSSTPSWVLPSLIVLLLGGVAYAARF